MSRCVKLILAYAFDMLDAIRIEALPKTRNAGSRRVLEKNGFVLEGILRSSAVKEGVVCDMAMYSVIRDQTTLETTKMSSSMLVSVVAAAAVSAALFISIYNKTRTRRR